MSNSEPRLPRTLVWTRSEEIFGNSVDFGAIPRIIRYLGTENSILSLTKACWLLEKWNDTSLEAQMLLVREFLEDRCQRRAIELIQQGRVVFFRTQFYVLMKYIARYGLTGETPRPVSKQELLKLGMALLAVVDLIDAEGKKKRRSLGYGEDLSSVVLELVTTSYVLRFPDPALALARARYLYVDIHRRLAVESPADFVDIEEVFREATGVGLDEYLSIGIGILSHHYKYDSQGEQITKESDFTVFHPRRYFDGTILNKETLNRVLDAISMTVDDFRSQVERQSRREMAYDFLAMKAYPFLRLGDDAFALTSFSYLFERLTTGVYWIIFDYLKDNYADDFHLRFSRYNGIIFQEYVQELVGHAVERRATDESLITDQAYRVGKKELRTPDIMLFTDDSAVLIEASATRIQAKRTTSLGIEKAFREDCEKMVFANARSLDTFIQNAKDARICVDGVDFEGVTRFYPVIVTIEAFPKYPVLDVYIDGEIEKRGLLAADDIAPLSLVDIQDIETIEKYGVNLIEALRSWHSSKWFPHQALSDHIVSKYGKGETPALDGWLGSIVEQSFSEATKLIFGRSIRGVGSTRADPDDE